MITVVVTHILLINYIAPFKLLIVGNKQTLYNASDPITPTTELPGNLHNHDETPTTQRWENKKKTKQNLHTRYLTNQKIKQD